MDVLRFILSFKIGIYFTMGEAYEIWTAVAISHQRIMSYSCQVLIGIQFQYTPVYYSLQLFTVNGNLKGLQ